MPCPVTIPILIDKHWNKNPTIIANNKAHSNEYLPDIPLEISPERLHASTYATANNKPGPQNLNNFLKENLNDLLEFSSSNKFCYISALFSKLY